MLPHVSLSTKTASLAIDVNIYSSFNDRNSLLAGLDFNNGLLKFQKKTASAGVQKNIFTVSGSSSKLTAKILIQQGLSKIFRSQQEFCKTFSKNE